MKIKNICVNCGSNTGTRPEYLKAAVDLGTYLAKNDIGLVYGGAGIGLMGAVASSAMDNGGNVIGVIPESFADRVAHDNLKELHVVSTMHERKTIMFDLSDGLYLVDKNRIITYWNKAAEKISGYSAEEVIGKSCSDNILTHVDSDGKRLCTSVCPLAAAMVDNTPREAEVYMHHKDGHRVPASTRISTLTDANG